MYVNDLLLLLMMMMIKMMMFLLLGFNGCLKNGSRVYFLIMHIDDYRMALLDIA